MSVAGVVAAVLSTTIFVTFAWAAGAASASARSALLSLICDVLRVGLGPEETGLRLEEELQKGDAPAAKPPAWRKLRHTLPREPVVWVIVGVTLVLCVALLLLRR